MDEERLKKFIDVDKKNGENRDASVKDEIYKRKLIHEIDVLE